MPKHKPAKPTPDFPLFAHQNGQWCKKIRGKQHHFGIWADPQAALKRYLHEAPFWKAGRTPPPASGVEIGCRLCDLCNQFLASKENKVATGELKEKTFTSYVFAAKLMTKFFGRDIAAQDLKAADFAAFRVSLAQGRNLKSLDDNIGMCRSIFKYGYDSGFLENPIRYGQEFNRVKKSDLRKQRQRTQQAHGKRMFEAGEIHTLIANAPANLAAMIHLGINLGFGNTDCASLPQSVIDGEWIEFPRPKTGIERRGWLWPETRDAIDSATGNKALVFATKHGNAYVRPGDDAIAKAFHKLLVKCELKRPGLGFYALRHTFETVAGEAGDQVAVNHVMGHADNSMAAAYRESISDHRLKAVTEYVRQWMFAG